MENALLNVGKAFFGDNYWVDGVGFNGIDGGFAFPLLGVLCYITGILIVAQSVVRAARAAQTSGGNPHNSVWTGPIVGFLIGGVLVAIPQTVMDLNATFFEDEKILSYKNTAIPGLSFSNDANEVIQTLVLFIQFIGWISIIRGFLILKRTADGGNQSWAVGITHIIGGTLSSNVMAFADALQQTICNTGTQCLFQVS